MLITFLLFLGSVDVLLLSLLVVDISLDLLSLLSDRYRVEIPLSESVILGARDVLEYSTSDVFLSLFPSMSEYLDLYSVVLSPYEFLSVDVT